MTIPSRFPCAQAWEFHLEEGKSYARKEEYDPAILAFTEAIQAADLEIRCPKVGSEVPFHAYFEALLQRGLALYQQSKHALAKKDLDEVIHSPARVEAASQNNPAVHKAKDRIFGKLIKLIIEARVQRGQIRLEQGKTLFAIKDFTKAIIRNPQNFYANYCRGLAFEEMGEFDQAEEDFQRAQDIDGKMFGLLKPHHVHRPSPQARHTLSDVRFGVTH